MNLYNRIMDIVRDNIKSNVGNKIGYLVFSQIRDKAENCAQIKIQIKDRTCTHVGFQLAVQVRDVFPTKKGR